MKPKTYIFVFFLLLVLFFILGIRYGQYVEKQNKVIDYLLKITPTKLPTITPFPTIAYTEYKSRRWGLKFVYPKDLKIEESTKGAEIYFKKE